ncbi:MAG: hypothetical protein IJ748_01115, partial [Bacteroidales bacterium]|nr:hypothetical protein [Bacteroidales bacterium]
TSRTPFQNTMGVSFLLCAGLSCYQTIQSWILFMPSIPAVVIYAVMIAFYILTSWLFSIFLDTCNSEKIFRQPIPSYPMKRRTWCIISLLLGVIGGWILLSLPTNTHSFVYPRVAPQIASDKLSFLDNQLYLLSSEETIKKVYDDSVAGINQRYTELWADFEREVRRHDQPGVGKEAREKLQKIRIFLNKKDDYNTNVQFTASNPKDLNTKKVDYYRTLTLQDLESYIQGIKVAENNRLTGFREEAREQNIGQIRKDINVTLRELKDENIDTKKVLKKASKLEKNSQQILEGSYKYMLADKSYGREKDKHYKLERINNPYASIVNDYVFGNNRTPFKDA